jgi:hypothetical protein
VDGGVLTEAVVKKILEISGYLKGFFNLFSFLYWVLTLLFSVHYFILFLF